MKHKIMAAVVGLGLMASAHAADTSATINVRKALTPVGVSPQIGIVKATATNAANGFTVDVLAPRGSANIVDILPVAYNVSGSVKPLQISVSGKTITVSGSTLLGASSSLVVGDYVKALVIYNP